MTFLLTIKTDEQTSLKEIARLIRQAAEELESGFNCGNVQNQHGATIGAFGFKR